eukprot:4048327-Pleurochrysis_carterae.AAC.1
MRARASHFVATDRRKSARYTTSSALYINLAVSLPGNRVRIRPEVRIYLAQISGLQFKHEQHGYVETESNRQAQVARLHIQLSEPPVLLEPRRPSAQRGSCAALRRIGRPPAR